MSTLESPLVSVIIPCYNQGEFVDEAVDSVLAQTYPRYEVIIVNDGSTDHKTNELLGAFDKPKTRVIRTANRGLGAARNTGISASSGEYILPLDADDKIGPTYMEKAIPILEARADVGIVYCEAEYFGEMQGRWDLPDYRFPEILFGNMIFCSSFFRKSDWGRTGGYIPRLAGMEDHDFWLSLLELGRQVVRIPEVLFYYRKRAGSMISFLHGERLLEAYVTLYRRHKDLYRDEIRYILELAFNEREELLQELSWMKNSKVWKLRELYHAIRRSG